jgi:hypothetical protein
MVLEGMFSPRSRARVIQIRTQLTAAKKKGTPPADYFRQMKHLADTLAAIGQPLREEETISYILAGLGPDYDALVTSLTTRNNDITLDGQRLLGVVAAELAGANGITAAPQIQVVLNWFEELKARVPGK